MIRNKRILPLLRSTVNTNEAIYYPEEDLYNTRYTLPEVTVTGDKSKRVYHSHSPRASRTSKNQYKLQTGDLLGAMTTGMNVLSPSLWWGAIRDAEDLQDGFNKLMRGNSGFVTQNYELEHPYISTAINLAGDAAALGVLSGIKNPKSVIYNSLPKTENMVVWKPIEKAGGVLMSAAKNQASSANIYRGLRYLGMPQKASKELLQSPELAYKRFKNLDIFDKIRGIKYMDDVYHGSRNSFDINNAKTYSSVRHDTGFHLGSSETPAYSKANGILGGTLYSGKLKLKEEPFEIRDLNTWDIDAIGGEAYNNPAFMQYLKKHGIDVDDLLKKGYELDHEYNFLNAPELEKYLAEHGGMLSDKYLADLFKKHNINLKYKNEFETFSNTPEYSYAIYNPDNIVWNKSFKFSKKPEVLEKLKDLGIAKDYLLPDYHIDLPDLYATLQSFPEFKLPQIRKN